MPSYEERVASVERRLTPAVRQAVERAIALNRVPAPLRPVLTQSARDGFGGRGGPQSEGLRPAAEPRGHGRLAHLIHEGSGSEVASVA